MSKVATHVGGKGREVCLNVRYQPTYRLRWLREKVVF